MSFLAASRVGRFVGSAVCRRASLSGWLRFPQRRDLPMSRATLTSMSLSYHCRLPHWAPAGKDLFLTWRLHGSLPPYRYVPPTGLSSGQAFVCIDRFTAREANRILGRTGLPFWQKEFFDHWIRNEQEFERVRAYIERNPVTAGLAAAPDQYRWSSALATRPSEAARQAGSSPRLATPQE